MFRCVFFFSSRRRHTRYWRDWSSDVCSSDLGGIGMGYFLGIEPMIGALVFSILSALGIAKIKRGTNTNSDTLIGMFWSLGMALGIIFIAFTPGYPPDMNSYL